MGLALQWAVDLCVQGVVGMHLGCCDCKAFFRSCHWTLTWTSKNFNFTLIRPQSGNLSSIFWGLSPSQRVKTKQNNKGPDAVSDLWSNKS